MPDLFTDLRKQNFRNIIRENPLIKHHTATYKDETPSIGLQWHEGTDAPSRIVGYPDQSYYSSFYLIFMFAQKRSIFEIRLEKMPYKNYDEFIVWHKNRRKISRNLN